LHEGFPLACRRFNETINWVCFETFTVRDWSNETEDDVALQITIRIPSEPKHAHHANGHRPPNCAAPTNSRTRNRSNWRGTPRPTFQLSSSSWLAFQRGFDTLILAAQGGQRLSSRTNYPLLLLKISARVCAMSQVLAPVTVILRARWTHWHLVSKARTPSGPAPFRHKSGAGFF
jgi:hypothetical protein